MKINTQRFLARRAKVSDAQLSKILAGSTRPSWNLAKRLAEATESDPVSWIEGDAEFLSGIKSAIKASRMGWGAK